MYLSYSFIFDTLSPTSPVYVCVTVGPFSRTLAIKYPRTSRTSGHQMLMNPHYRLWDPPPQFMLGILATLYIGSHSC